MLRGLGKAHPVNPGLVSLLASVALLIGQFSNGGNSKKTQKGMKQHKLHKYSSQAHMKSLLFNPNPYCLLWALCAQHTNKINIR